MPTESIFSPWRNLIETSRVMSLAVADKTQAWSAPVYYLFMDKKFYFFSNPRARHIQMANGYSSAGSIFKDDADFKKLEGIQMSGIIQKSPMNALSLVVAKNYYCQFKLGLKTKEPSDLLGFFASKFHATLYFFEPRRVYYMDNRKGVGSREKIEL